MNKTEFQTAYRAARRVRNLVDSLDGEFEALGFDLLRHLPNEAWMAAAAARFPSDALAVPFAERWFNPYECTRVYGPMGVLS